MTKFAALMKKPGLEHFLQEKLLIMAYFPPCPLHLPPAKKFTPFLSLIWLTAMVSLKTKGKKRCLKGTQLSSTLSFHDLKRL